MDLQSIKSSFFSYLQEQEKNNGTASEDTKLSDYSDISIFSHAKEFKEFISDEYNMPPEILSMSVSDILKLEIINGKLVDPKKQNRENGQEETDDTEKETPDMVDVMNLLMQDKDFQAQYDSDGNGKIDGDEFNTFQNSVKGLDGNEEDISLDDIIEKTLERNENTEENAEEEKVSEEREIPETEANTSATEEVPQAGASSANNTYNPSSTGGGGGYTPDSAPSYNNNVSNNTAQSSSSVENMTLEELEQEKTAREGDVSTAQEDMNKIYSGENEQVKKAMEQEEEAKNAYIELVENDESISDELKKALSDKLQEISDQKKTINDLKVDLNKANNKITEQETLIASDESNISAIEESISSLSSQETDDPEVQSQIDSNLEVLEQKKKEAEDKRDADKKVLEEELIPAKDDIENTQLPEAEDALEDLEAEKAEIDKQIADTCSPETKEAIEEASKAYDEAEANVQNVQTSEMTEAQQNLEKADQALEEVNDKINEKQAEKLQSEYSVANEGKEVLKRLEEAGGDAYNGFDKLCSTLGMSEEEAAQYISDLCSSPEWGNGCIDPVIFIAQICQESGFRADAVGDGGKAVGLGQLWEICVREVNQYNGKNYTYEDRLDPEKNLEMSILYLKEGYDMTGDLKLALGFYNQGSVEAAKGANGQAYINAVLGRLNNVPV